MAVPNIVYPTDGNTHILSNLMNDITKTNRPEINPAITENNIITSVAIVTVREYIFLLQVNHGPNLTIGDTSI